MSRRQAGHWMITSTATGDDIHYVQQATTGITNPPEQFVGFSQRVEFIHVDWSTLGEKIRPLVVEKEKNHFSNEEELFEI